jgi:hypothetical protein
MATDFASLKIEVDAKDTVKANAELDKLAQQGTKTEKAMLGLSSAARSLGIALSAVGIASFIKKGIDALDTLNDLSLKTGIAAGKLAGFQLAAKQSGTSIDTFAHAVNVLSVNMANNSKQFQKLGVDAKAPEEAFLQMVGVLGRVKDQQTKAALAQQVFNRSWQELAPLMAMGESELRKVVIQGEKLSGVTTQAAKDADQFNDQLEIMTSWLGSLSIKIAGPVISTLNEFANNLRNTTSEAVTFLNVMRGISDFAMNRKSLSGAQAEFNTLQEQISAQEKRIKGLSSLNKSSSSSSGIDISTETKKLNDLYAAQDIVINKIGESTKQLGEERKKTLDPQTVSDFIGTTEKASEASSKSVKSVKGLSAAYEELGPSSDLYFENLQKQKDALASIEDQYLRLTLSARDYYALTLTKQVIAPSDQGPMLEKFDQIGQIEATNAAKQSLDSYIASIDTANQSLSSLGATSSSVFDSALGGISAMAGAFQSMTDVLQQNTARLVENGKQQKTALSINDRTKYNKLIVEEKNLNAANYNASLAGVRQIAGATASMFGENTKARKTFHAVEMGLGAIEIAQTIKGLAARGAEAILTQGKGDPYSAFFRIAAMTAIVGGIIAAAGGSFKGSSASAPSTAQGTGTVLGDSTAQSESVNKTFELLKDIHAEEYAELRGINSGIKSLTSAIKSTLANIFQTGGVGNIEVGGLGKQLSGLGQLVENGITEPLGAILKNVPVIGGIISGISNFVFGSTKKSIEGGGLSFGDIDIAKILQGAQINAQQYTTVKTEKKGFLGGLFGGNSTSFEDVFSPLDKSVTSALTLVFSSAANVMLGLAQQLGEGLSAQVQKYVIAPFKIDLKDLNAEDAAKKLNAVISSTLDKMTADIFGKLIAKYQELGEGLLETAIRIVAQMAVVRDALVKGGGSLSKNAIEISNDLIKAAGGIAEFQGQFATYYDKFFTETEKQVNIQKQLTANFTELNLKLPESRREYRKLIQSLDLTNVKNRERYSMMLRLAGVADDYYSVIEETAKKQRDRIIEIRNEWKGLTDSIYNEIRKIRGEAAPKTTQASFNDFMKEVLLARGGSKQSARALPGLAEAVLAKGKESSRTGLEFIQLQLKVANALELAASTLNKRFSIKTPKFADGGVHDGGFRIVGERGPELEYTGPSRIFSANDTGSMLDNRPLIAEIRALRNEVSNLKSATESTAYNTRKTSDILRNVTQDGQSILTTAA